MPAIDWRAQTLLSLSFLLASTLTVAVPVAALGDPAAVPAETAPDPQATHDQAEPSSPCAPSPPADPSEEVASSELVLVAGRCITTSELDRLLDGYESAVAEEAAALTELRSAFASAQELQLAVEATRLSVAQATRRLADANAEVIRATDRERLALTELAAVNERLAAERTLLRDQSVAAYITGNDARKAVQDRALDPGTTNEIASTRAYGRVLVETQGDQVDLVAQLQVAASALDAELAEARRSADDARAALVDVETTAEEIGRELTRLADEANTAATEQGLHLVSIQMRRDEFAAQLGVTPPSTGQLAAVLNAASVAGASTRLDTRLGSPLEATSIGSVFGPRLHPIFNEVRPHTGIDLSGAAGAPIFATAAGEVVVAGDEGGYGRTVAIDHGGGVITLYAHQSAIAVGVGDQLAGGDLVGYVGSTGYSTGPHLHFELRLDGRPVDPLPFVDLGTIAGPGAGATPKGEG